MTKCLLLRGRFNTYIHVYVFFYKMIMKFKQSYKLKYTNWHCKQIDEVVNENLHTGNKIEYNKTRSVLLFQTAS